MDRSIAGCLLLLLLSLLTSSLHRCASSNALPRRHLCLSRGRQDEPGIGSRNGSQLSRVVAYAGSRVRGDHGADHAGRVDDRLLPLLCTRRSLDLDLVLHLRLDLDVVLLLLLVHLLLQLLLHPLIHAGLHDRRQDDFGRDLRLHLNLLLLSHADAHAVLLNLL